MLESQITKMAEDVLNETNLWAIPIVIVSIANFYGFTVYSMILQDDTSGLIMADKENIQGFDTNKVIVLNKLHSQARRRFTMAHELGHYFLDGRNDVCFAHRDNNVYTSQERDANSFASALLMPEDDIKRAIQNAKKIYFGEWQLFIIPNIANIFGVSESAAEVRLKKLKLI